MKVLCILGSPRKHGNSAAISSHLLNKLEEKGANVTSFALNELNFKGCQGCGACKTKAEECVLRDDLTNVLKELKDSDVVVMSSPVYCYETTAATRAFIERAYSFFVPDFITNPVKSRLKPGKKLVFILTQGNPNEKAFADIVSKHEGFFKMHGFEDTYLIRACGVLGISDIKNRPDIFKQAEEIAEKLLY